MSYVVGSPVWAAASIWLCSAVAPPGSTSNLIVKPSCGSIYRFHQSANCWKIPVLPPATLVSVPERITIVLLLRSAGHEVTEPGVQLAVIHMASETHKT